MITFIQTFGILTFIIISFEKIFFTLEVNSINASKYFRIFIFSCIAMFIWISYTANILKDANIYNIIAFLLSNVLGTLFGVYINNYLNKDIVTLRAYIDIDNNQIISSLNNYNTTLIKCSGLEKEYYILIITMQKKELNNVINIIKEFEKNTFIVVNKSMYTRINNI